MNKPLVLVTQAVAEAMCAMQDDGFTVEQIGDRFGYAPSTVGRSMRKVRLGLPFAKPTISTSTPDAAEEAHQIHLGHVLRVEPHGFGWWKPEIMARVYRLERASPKRSTFGVAA